MDRYALDEVVAPQPEAAETPLKDWRLKFEAGSLQRNDLIDFFKKQSRQYYNIQYENEKDASRPSLKCSFKEAGAKEGIIDVLLEFMLGGSPKALLEKLRLEGNVASVCGKVFKNGEPTYSCRECGMDPTCVLCVSCFKQSAHRFHKYKMSTSSGGGCCDCADGEAWKKDCYCTEHMHGKENPPESTLVTDEMKERCQLAFVAILTFCVEYLHIESIASLTCLDGDSEDSFCTVLYNDESHTFDQVIQTLTRIVKCRQKDATEIVSSIDREGRAVVKCDTFKECALLKEAIEKQSVTVNATIPTSRASQSLRVSVLHVQAVACQQFALQLLTWFQEFLTRHRTFRLLFAKVIMEKNTKYSIQTIFRCDAKLWKTARTCFHRLLISGMLMEYDNKMALAGEFSRNYATIVRDFIIDDHEHSYSIVSLSVQLFTVPSIAHYLIANESIFYKLLHIFYHPSIEEHISNKTLHFAKNITNLPNLKRAAYILSDLKYILSFKPEVWTEELRDGFLEGCKSLLRLLNVMQGMEWVERKIDQHLDYEPEWESAFNLHIKLASTITLVLEWCATDREVLLKFYQMVMRYMASNTFILSDTKSEEQTVAGHIAKCLMYDVACKPVSIHIPLSRIFSGVYLHLGTYGLTFDNAPASMKRSPEELLEPILCTQTMIAQVNSGMWRRNGYALLHQLYFYRNVRCRSEMLDRDIVGMQIGAALIESNQYLIHLLSKYNLIKWIQPGYEQKLAGVSSTDDEFIRQLSMIDEFLEQLIVIIGERYMPGIANISEEERIKKEIIQLLCIKPYSHSELHRQLPDSNNDTILEDVIDSVAVFKKPAKSDAKGVYELREHLYDAYNMYFYHYTKEEKSKSEETQRLRRKGKGDLVCCPPPQLPKLSDGFISIANLLQCDVMLEILSTVLDRALDLKARSFLENHLQKVLHLIGYGVQEEQSGHYAFLSFCERAQKHKLLFKLEELSRSVRVEAHRDFIIWTVRKFKEAQGVEADAVTMQSEDAEPMAQSDTVKTAQVLVTTPEQERQEKEERARLAAERRAKIMEQIQSAQKRFMKSNAEMFASTNAVAQSSDASSMEWQAAENNDEGAVGYNSVACLGVDRRLPQPEEQNYKCILCFEDCTVSKEAPTLVYSAFVQKSRVLPPTGGSLASLHASSCGHVMHVNCWQEYYSNEESKEQRRPHRVRAPSVPTQTIDFQCPYCRCLSNAVLPLTAPLSKYAMPHIVHAGGEVFPIDLWTELMRTFAEELNKVRENEDADMFYELPAWPALLESLLGDVAQFELIAQPIERPTLPRNWPTFVHHYIKSVRQYTASLNQAQDSNDSTTEGLQWMWQSCIYTVQALEVYLRAIDKPFKSELSIRHKSCLSGLIRASCLYAACVPAAEMTAGMAAPVMQLLDTVFRQKGACVLEWNCFSMLVSMILMVPNMLVSTTPNKVIVPNGSILDFYTMKLFFLANLVKAIVLYEPNAECYMDIDEECAQDMRNMSPKLQQSVLEFYRKHNFAARRQATDSPTQAEPPGEDATHEVSDATDEMEQNARTIAALFDHVKAEMRELLRCCCLFFHFVTDVEFPDEFVVSGNDTFENMCKYLGLQSALEVYFDNESSYATIMESFVSHPDIRDGDVTTRQKCNGEPFDLVPCTRPLPSLVELPEDYSDLINSVSDFSCPHNEREEMKSPTMCLICGVILCGQSYCCQPDLYGHTVGACTYHAYHCGAEIGLFLRIRDCHVVYLGRNKGGFVLPPYLDEYGETDQGLRRGNPLRLCPARYRKILLTWLGHGLHEEIARLNDTTSSAITQWHHM